MAHSDRRVRKTEAAITKAIVVLLEKERFFDITVQEISDEADIGKATFYRHYPDKYALVRDIVTKKLESFYQKMPVGPEIMMTLDNLQQLREFVDEIKPFRGINDAELDVEGLIKSWLTQFLKNTVLATMQRPLYVPQTTAKILAATLLALLDDYNSGAVLLTPESVNHQLVDLRSVLAGLNYDM